MGANRMLLADGNEYKNFKHITRERLLHEMLRFSKMKDPTSVWKVLIMDKFTLKIMSSACKMADITDEGVSCKNTNTYLIHTITSFHFVVCAAFSSLVSILLALCWDQNTEVSQECLFPFFFINKMAVVEDICRRRQPLPSMDAIYFIQPSIENVIMFLSDVGGRTPLYKKAFVFFSSPIAKDLLNHIKKEPIRERPVVMEMNLEYLAIDSQCFITDNERALEQIFGDNESASKRSGSYLHSMATRIATVFASLRELPFVRYRAAKFHDATSETTYADLIPTKLAAGVWNCLMEYKQKLHDFPQTETCDLLILDRSVDQVAPVIHEWFYDAMCHDLLNMEGSKYAYKTPSKYGGPSEKREAFLDENDPVWLEIRHAHIADAGEHLHEKMTNFKSKYKAAQVEGSRDINEFSSRDMQKMVQELPQYSEQIEKISLHVEIAGRIYRIIRELGLKEIGQLEQDLVFGDAGLKDVINFLTREEENTTRENKLRLLMTLAAVYPQELDSEKGLNLMKLANLPAEDMSAVHNMRLLGGPLDNKKSSTGTFSFKFDILKRNNAAKQGIAGVEEQPQLSRFCPMIKELIKKLSKGELSEIDYPCLNEPNESSQRSFQTSPKNQAAGQSIRSRRTSTWAKPRSTNTKNGGSLSQHNSSNVKKMGQRIFVFIVGGATRSELRACHNLTDTLKREVVLGSSSLDDPPQFLTKMKLLRVEGLSLDEIQL